MDDVLEKDGIYICPQCKSKRITEVSQNVLVKMADANTRKEINPRTGKGYMSNRDKASEYDMASCEGAGCWHYECRNCGWKSSLYTE